jgi:hypothetical protein
MPRPFASIAAVLFAVSLAPEVFAAPEQKIAFRLEYEPPEGAGCPTADALALMLAGEFGYLVVRTDVSPVLRVAINRTAKGFEAELSAPDPTGNAETWHGKTNPQATCRELAYDLAYLVKLRLGPRAWPGEEPPPSLAAPPEIELGRPVIAPMTPRLPDAFAIVVPRVPASIPSSSEGEERIKLEASLGAVVSPYGLPSVALGGSFMPSVRWKRLAFAFDIRGVITPSASIGDAELPGRTTAWTASLLPCAALPHVDLCGVVSFGQMQLDLGKSYTVTGSDAFSMGFGARIAGRIPLSQRFTLVPFGEGTMQLRTISIQLDPNVTGAKEPIDWRSPTLRLTFGVAVAANLLE